MSRESSEIPSGEPLQQLVCDRVRSMRKAKGWTLEQLASLSGVSRSMLSEIERGSANPTLGVAFRIAQAFGMTLGDLVDSPEPPKPRIDVIRSDDRSFMFRDDSDCRIRTLSPLHLEKDVEFYELTLRTGGKLESQPHFEGTREFLTVEKGVVRLTAGSETSELKQGDSAHYPADVPHEIRNIGRGEAVVFLVDIYGRPSQRR
ncbi:transcriptional regulator, XRE family [Pirellula staleyi DSM 6068]|uniref:Transcriptional regulator, XRE family n=1 Tax=Pirellula staleyi (strain ATCC 27377 / DSM 6068 / ICPB 4128) TaxID=530564 RepID=D2R569_PIRSD|nr:XRE family transcriptional regulator [Pirellula staleyi]ADB19031.1 transcriptional regulator, XRE family [Pirellula staleyi DSM 6068]